MKTKNVFIIYFGYYALSIYEAQNQLLLFLLFIFQC